jgi:CHAT domain-containing protein
MFPNPNSYPPQKCAHLRPFFTAVLTLSLAVICACSRRGDPQAVLDHAVQTLRTGDISSAQKEAESGYAEFGSASPEWAWKFKIVRARAIYWRGMYNDVLELLESQPPPPCCGDIAVQRYRLESVTESSLHKFQQAERYLAAAQRICAGSPSPSCADLESTLGKLEMEKGHYAVAQGVFNRELVGAHARGDQFMEAAALLDLGWAATEQDHLDEALDWNTSAYEISVQRGFIDMTQTAQGNKGWTYYELGDRDRARETLLDAGGLAAKLGDIGDEVSWFTDAGYTYLDDGNFPATERIFLQSLELAKKINSPEDIVNSLIALAFVSEQTNKLDDAQRYADEALKMAKAAGNGRDVVYPLLVEGRVAARRNDAATAEADFREVAKSADTPVFLKWEAERSLARLYEAENHSGAANAEYRTALSTFEAARCDLHQRVDSRLPFLTNAARIYEDYIHFLVARGKTDEALHVADYTRARTLTEGLGRPCKPKFAPDPLNAPESASRAGGMILFYALGQEHSYLWAISPREAKMFPLAANQSEIDTAVQNYRKKLEGPPQILEASNDGSELYKMLVAPAESFLKKESSAKNIFIIPDGALNSLNFETLLPQPHHYWIEDVTIANAPSLRLLPTSRDNRRELVGKLLLVGNPASPNTGSDNAYPELPNAAAQIEAIKKYFPADHETVFARQQASPDAYLNNHPEQFSYIHFVAHGTASRMSPLDSAIILSREANSPSTAQDDSFKLYARDIINNHPLHAELVTISACYSTGNRTYSGEGLVGLSWAFLRAGAHNVVAALWDVSDASTPQLVDEFYNQLKKGKPPATALRSAKLSLLHSATFHSPFYWAPFQLYTGS